MSVDNPRIYILHIQLVVKATATKKRNITNSETWTGNETVLFDGPNPEVPNRERKK